MTWLPFELHPDTPEAGMPLAEYFGSDPAQLGQMHAHLQQRADQLGLPFRPTELLANTRHAHLLAATVEKRQPDRLPALHRQLFHAYWAKGKNLGTAQVLAEACEAVGLDPALVAQSASDPEAQRHLMESAAMARRLGVTGAPTFILNDRYKVVGAQPYDVLVGAFRRVEQADS